MAGNLLSDGFVSAIRAGLARLAGTKSAPVQGPPRAPGEGGSEWFWARIKGWSPIIANARWRYSWEEILIENDNDILYGGGLSGTTADYYALNAWEFNNIAAHTGAQADGIPQTSPYPANFQLLPIGGGTGGIVANQAVVQMFILPQTDGSFRPMFCATNAHFGSCT